MTRISVGDIREHVESLIQPAINAIVNEIRGELTKRAVEEFKQRLTEELVKITVKISTEVIPDQYKTHFDVALVVPDEKSYIPDYPFPHSAKEYIRTALKECCNSISFPIIMEDGRMLHVDFHLIPLYDADGNPLPEVDENGSPLT